MPAKAKLTTRNTATSTVSTDNLAKGSELTFNEADSNFINLRDQTFAITDGSTSSDVTAGDTITVTGTGGITVTQSSRTVTIDGSGVSGSGGTGDLSIVGSTITAPSNADLSLDTSGTGSVNAIGSFTVSRDANPTGNQIFRATDSYVDFNHDGVLSGAFRIWPDAGQAGGAIPLFEADWLNEDTVKIHGLTYPATDGSANHLLKTDGNGNLSFVALSSLQSPITVLDDTSTSLGLNQGDSISILGGTGCSTALTGNTLTIDFDQTSIPTQPANTGDFEFLGSTMSGTVTNGNVTIEANGSGNVILDGYKVQIGDDDSTGPNPLRYYSTNNPPTLRSAKVDDDLVFEVTESLSDIGGRFVFRNATSGGDCILSLTGTGPSGGTAYIGYRGLSGATRLTSGTGVENILTDLYRNPGWYSSYVEVKSGNGVGSANADVNIYAPGTGKVNVTGDIQHGSTLTTKTLLTEGVSITDNIIRSSRSNDDLVIQANGSGTIDIREVATSTTIGANGAASALTANPVGYLKIKIAGTEYQIPYYNT